MQKITGELTEVGTWWSVPRSVMEGYVEYIKIGDTRYRKVGCPADLHDFLTGQVDAPITLFMHKWLGTTKIILAARNEQTGDKMAFHLPSLIVLMMKTFVLLAVLWLIILMIFISYFMPYSTMGFMPMLYLALLFSGAIIFFQSRAFFRAKAAL